MSLSAALVLTDASLFPYITAFITDVPNSVHEFKNLEFAKLWEEQQRVYRTSKSRRRWRSSAADARTMNPELLLWQVALIKEDKRVLEALLQLSRTSRYNVVPHVLGVDILSFAIAHTQDIDFLD